MKKNLILVATAAICLLSKPSLAAPIAIIDSGTDLSHPDLVNKQWTNPGDPDDAVDNDDNGLIDDTHGWNFAENDNHLYDKKLVGTFKPEIYQFFDVQLRGLLGTATAEDKQWIETHKADKAYLSQLELFANWMHGTHVAGISAKDADAAQIMGLKIIPTKAGSLLDSNIGKALAKSGADKGPTPEWRKKLIMTALKGLAAAQSTTLAQVSKWVDAHGAKVANCSFGTSTTNVKKLFEMLLPKLLGHTPSDEELTGYAVTFVSLVNNSMEKKFIEPAPNTLFVIAAGNDGANNDLLPSAPSNIKLDNTITVAATVNYDSLASFSNYGEKMVDIAAPGVGIKSTIPGHAYLAVSGTSQAAPFVTNLAGRIMDANPNLTLTEVKQVLMETVDKKEFLQAKVRSGGIANPARALEAAKLSVTHSLSAAIDMARAQIVDVASTGHRMPERATMVLPLPSLFN